jgi:imidazolonepropionase-like amidohydrolase
MSARDRNLTVMNALIFDGHSQDLVEGSIRIEDGVIVEIGSELKPSERQIEAHGRVVIPGLLDNHFHAYGISLNMIQMEGSPRSYVALKSRKRLEAALRRGFTTVRDVAGGDAGLKMAIDEGLVKSPNYYFTGPALSQTGGHGDSRTAELDVSCSGNHSVEVVDGVENLRLAVRERLRRGAHAIKIMASGGVVSLSDLIQIPQYSSEEIRAVTEESNRLGSYVAAHAYSPEAIIHAVTNGVRSIEHANLLNDAAALAMVERNAVMVPTLITYQAMAKFGRGMGMSEIALRKNEQVLEAGKQAIEIAMSHGIVVGFGTDLMGDLEEAQLEGLRVQHEVQGTLELLRSTTSRNANILRTNQHGWIKPGMTGDLVILDGNPFDRPSLLWTHSEGRIVIKGGDTVD